LDCAQPYSGVHSTSSSVHTSFSGLCTAVIPDIPSVQVFLDCAHLLVVHSHIRVCTLSFSGLCTPFSSVHSHILSVHTSFSWTVHTFPYSRLMGGFRLETY